MLIPVFALGRAQELCILLETYWYELKEVINIDYPVREYLFLEELFTVLSQGKNELKSSNFFLDWTHGKGWVLLTYVIIQGALYIPALPDEVFTLISRPIIIINYSSRGQTRRFVIRLYRETCLTLSTLRCVAGAILFVLYFHVYDRACWYIVQSSYNTFIRLLRV